MSGGSHRGTIPRLPPPLTAGGKPALADPEALLRRFVMAEVLGRPVSQRGRRRGPPGPSPTPADPESTE